jgi:hypothetical protein
MVMLPIGTPLGIPGDTPAAPIVGKAALGSTVHPPAVELGHVGTEEVYVEAYAADMTPVGVKVAHCAARFVKSGTTGVGLP